MSRYSLSAVGTDQPGIVAALAAALAAVGGNLEESTMTLLQNQFAVLLLVACPDPMTLADLDAAVSAVADRFDLTVAVRAIPPDSAADDRPAAEVWTVAVSGADRPGIVAEITDALAAGGGNIVDLDTHLVGGPTSPVYVMTLRATLPAGGAGAAAADEVRRAATRLEVHCTVHRDQADLL